MQLDVQKLLVKSLRIDSVSDIYSKRQLYYILMIFKFDINERPPCRYWALIKRQEFNIVAKESIKKYRDCFHNFNKKNEGYYERVNWYIIYVDRELIIDKMIL